MGKKKKAVKKEFTTAAQTEQKTGKKKVARVCVNCHHRPDVTCHLGGNVMKDMDFCSQFKEK